MRPQDKWDQSNGYVSKSYKVHLDVAKEFTISYIIANDTQSNALTKLMKNFILDIRRNIPMFTFYYQNADPTHYDPVSNEMKNTTTLMNDLMQVELGKITSEDIHKEEDILLAGHSVGSKVFNEKVKEYKEFKTGDNLSEYLLKPDNILEYMRADAAAYIHSPGNGPPSSDHRPWHTSRNTPTGPVPDPRG